jgi:hypothetical protein
MLLAAMPRYAGPEGPRIMREVLPLELTPRESDPPRNAIVKAPNAVAGANGIGVPILGVRGNPPAARNR